MPNTETTRQGIELSARQRVAWLRLIRSDNIGPVTFRELINHFGSAEKALDALPELSRRGGSSRSPRIATQAEAESEIETADKFGARFVGIGEPDYPPALRQMDGAPPLIATAVPSKGRAGATGVSEPKARRAPVAAIDFHASMPASRLGPSRASVMNRSEACCCGCIEAMTPCWPKRGMSAGPTTSACSIRQRRSPL